MEKLRRISHLEEKNPFSDLSLRYGFLGKSQDKNFVSSLHSLKQVHGTDLVRASSFTKSKDLESKPSGDALFSEKKGEIVAVKTADCLPLLISDSSESFALAIHAGWRGLASGIVTKSLEAFGKNFSEIRVLMGPYINLDSFEVGPEVFEAFSLRAPEVCDELSFRFCYKKGKGDRFHFDLGEFAFLELLKLGVSSKNIVAFGGCTFTEDKLWHSYRREKESRGRNWSWIVL